MVVTSLPVPRARYDQAAERNFGYLRVDEYLDALRTAAVETATLSQEAASLIESVYTLLEAVVAGELDPGAEALNRLVATAEEAINNDQSVTYAVRGRLTAYALEAALEDSFDSTAADLAGVGITVRAGQSWTPPTPDQLVVASYHRLSDFEKVLTSGAEDIKFLLAPLTSTMLYRDIRFWLKRLDTLSVDPCSQACVDHARASAAKLVEALEEVDDFRVVLADESVAESLDNLVERRPSDRHQSTVVSRRVRSVVEIRFDGGFVAFLPPGALVTRLAAGLSTPKEVYPRELKEGDLVFFVDKGIHSSVYDVVNEIMTRSPVIGQAAQFMGLWYRVLQKSFADGEWSIESLLEAVRRSGSTITSPQTIRNWIRANVIGPKDLNDVDRLAAALGVAAAGGKLLVEVKQGIRNLRAVHRKFTKLVIQTATRRAGAELSDHEEAVLVDYGLTIDSVHEIVAPVTVTRVNPKLQVAAEVNVGKRLELAK
jgi:hypothetical protein